jgi:glutamate synthase (NADPH/NADH) small chain
MSENTSLLHVAGVRAGRLSNDEIEKNFQDKCPPLARSEALIEADRCYFCYDAPCTEACPTDIDIPGFIQQIRSDNFKGSARAILSENIMGGMCARVCPTEILCEEACVRNTHEDKPVSIGLLQRFATDPIFDSGTALFARATDSGRKVAIVGGGPAGLSCAHRLSVLGHSVVLFNRDKKLGGLNEYGIAAYKAVDDFAQREVEYILAVGRIDVRTESSLGSNVSLAELQQDYDAVFLACGLAENNSLGLPHENVEGILSAVDYIADLRQAKNKGDLPVGNRIIVIGGGMTAVDIAVQSKRLGAEFVSIVYRRGAEQMGASHHEQELAQTSGVTIRHWSQPSEILHGARVTGMQFERTQLNEEGKLLGTGESWSLEADVIFTAVGQTLDSKVFGDSADRLKHERGKLLVDEARRTSVAGLWAGGDCAFGHDDLTVTAVQDGKLAAIDIDQFLGTETEGRKAWQT